MMDITPFSARTPNASLSVDDGSFETDIDSISFGLIEFNLILLILPLTTINGSFLSICAETEIKQKVIENTKRHNFFICRCFSISYFEQSIKYCTLIRRPDSFHVFWSKYITRFGC